MDGIACFAVGISSVSYTHLDVYKRQEVKGMIDMARKDNKGRNLKTGEYQRPDGRYEYRYKDEITGKRNSVYAADLASLREMEKKINKDMDDLLITCLLYTSRCV